MTGGDLLIVIVLVAAAVIGARAGVIRGAGFAVGSVLVLAIGLWVRTPVGLQLGRIGPEWTIARSEMLALMAVLAAGYAVLLVIARGQGTAGTLRVLPGGLEPAAGVVLGVVGALLVIASIEAALAIGTGLGDGARSGGDLVADGYRALRATAIGTALHRTVITDLGSILAPLLPYGTRTALGIP